METGAILAIAAGALVVLGGVFAYVTTRARDRQAAVGALSRETRKKDKGVEAIRQEDTSRRASRELERAESRVLVDARPAPPAPREPLDPEAYGVTRRQFFNRGITAFFALGLAGFGTTVIAFLWPSLSGGFGSKIRAGSATDILSQISDSREPFYVPEGRFYVVPYPKGAVPEAEKFYTGGVLEGMESGFVALYQKCVHLGCRVPWCKASQWFECPCHGSRYNRVGEKTGGPAPRGLDRFPVAVEGGAVVVDTGQLSQGPPVGVDTTGQQAEGPHCA
jgi:cytochrome b6-f complex iron-sulfur subunit